MNHIRIHHLEKCKAEVKGWTEHLGDPEDKLRFLATKIEESLESDSAIDHLRRVVCIISSLLTNASSSTLNSSQVRNLVKMAETSLKVLQITPIRSKLSKVYGELHFAASLNHLEYGDHWQASWQQQLGFELARSNMPGGEKFNHYVAGIRFARLGHLQEGIRLLQMSRSMDSPTHRSFKTEMTIARSQRLMGDIAEAKRILRELEKINLTPEFQNEVNWEWACHRVIADCNCEPLVELVMVEKKHSSTAYAIEAFFWAAAIRHDRALRKLFKMRYLGKKYGAKELGKDFAIAKNLGSSPESVGVKSR